MPVALGSVAANANGLRQISAIGNGVPPTGPIEIITTKDPRGPHRDQVSESASTVACGPQHRRRGLPAWSLDGQRRRLRCGAERTLLAQSNALKSGVQQVLRTGRVQGIPTILVQGRNDALVPINHASRAYYARTRWRRA